tara:strand:+ start:2149 stop:2358 length:210 start_codon:yes stop_codon:yes gene_type:complete
MATREEVIEFIDEQWESGADGIYDKYWNENGRLSILQNWMSPEIAVILKKLVGDVAMVKIMAANMDNNK